MPNFFVDSSALVKRYQHEAGSDRVNELIQNAEELLIARLTIVEVSSALVRRARATGLESQELVTALSDLDPDVQDSLKIVEQEEPVMSHSIALTRRHGLRGADAIQLACALTARTDAPDFELVLVSDIELNAAAIAQGL